MKLRVLIADDEPLARERLRHFLRSEPNIEIVAECATGIDTVKSVRKASPDLLLLDVQMPGLDGLEVIQSLGTDHSPGIIFVTAYDQYALRAFEAHAVDYLLKPFDRGRLQIALRRARERLQRDTATPTNVWLSKVLATLDPPQNCLERVTIKSGGRISIVKTAEIDWIGAADNYVELHVGNSCHLLRMTIGALADQLSKNHFVRISRSLLVNLSRVKEIRRKFHGDCLIILENGTCLSASRSYRKHLARFLGGFSKPH